MTDPIADLLTRIRNAILAGHKVVEAPASNLKKEIARILFEKGYILSYKVVKSDNGQGILKIALKYNPKSKKPAIKELQRVSRPGMVKSQPVGCVSQALDRDQKIHFCEHQSREAASKVCVCQPESEACQHKQIIALSTAFRQIRLAGCSR